MIDFDRVLAKIYPSAEQFVMKGNKNEWLTNVELIGPLATSLVPKIASSAEPTGWAAENLSHIFVTVVEGVQECIGATDTTCIGSRVNP